MLELVAETVEVSQLGQSTHTDEHQFRISCAHQ